MSSKALDYEGFVAAYEPQRHTKEDAMKAAFEAGQAYEQSIDASVAADEGRSDSSRTADSDLYSRAELEGLSESDVNSNWEKVSRSMEALEAGGVS